MRRSKTESLTDILHGILRQQGLETPLNQQRLIRLWPEVTGPVIARYTRELYIRNQTLYVHLTSPALKNDLNMGRRNLVLALNEKTGAQVIADIVFI